jgi:hypothetical protein
LAQATQLKTQLCEPLKLRGERCASTAPMCESKLVLRCSDQHTARAARERLTNPERPIRRHRASLVLFQHGI